MICVWSFALQLYSQTHWQPYVFHMYHFTRRQNNLLCCLTFFFVCKPNEYKNSLSPLPRPFFFFRLLKLSGTMTLAVVFFSAEALFGSLLKGVNIFRLKSPFKDILCRDPWIPRMLFYFCHGLCISIYFKSNNGHQQLCIKTRLM